MVALPVQYVVLRLLMLHHMVSVAVAQGAGEGRSALLCVWLVAAADKRSAVARLYTVVNSHSALFGSRL